MRSSSRYSLLGLMSLRARAARPSSRIRHIVALGRSCDRPRQLSHHRPSPPASVASHRPKTAQTRRLRRVCIQQPMQVRMLAWRIHRTVRHPRRNSPVPSAPAPWLQPLARLVRRRSTWPRSANRSKSSKVSVSVTHFHTLIPAFELVFVSGQVLRFSQNFTTVKVLRVLYLTKY